MSSNNMFVPEPTKIRAPLTASEIKSVTKSNSGSISVSPHGSSAVAPSADFAPVASNPTELGSTAATTRTAAAAAAAAAVPAPQFHYRPTKTAAAVLHEEYDINRDAVQPYMANVDADNEDADSTLSLDGSSMQDVDLASDYGDGDQEPVQSGSFGENVWNTTKMVGGKVLNGVEFMGEVVADFLGITAPKYGYVIDAYERMQYRKRMERSAEREAQEQYEAEYAAEMNAMESGSNEIEESHPAAMPATLTSQTDIGIGTGTGIDYDEESTLQNEEAQFAQPYVQQPQV
jgi:FAM177 family